MAEHDQGTPEAQPTTSDTPKYNGENVQRALTTACRVNPVYGRIFSILPAGREIVEIDPPSGCDLSIDPRKTPYITVGVVTSDAVNEWSACRILAVRRQIQETGKYPQIIQGPHGPIHVGPTIIAEHPDEI